MTSGVQGFWGFCMDGASRIVGSGVKGLGMFRVSGFRVEVLGLGL